MAEFSRREILKKTADRILALELGRPVRVGIDGVTASGKSTFATDLCAILKGSYRPVILTSLDGFHNPRSQRYTRGRESAEGYYYDAYDYAAIVANLLQPLGPQGNKRYCTQTFDLQRDQPIHLEFTCAEDKSILIVDGSFALRPELRGHWDFSIFLEVSLDIAVERAVQRDAMTFGSADEARRVTKGRYHGAHSIHANACRPKEAANLVIQNDDPTNPKILIDRL